METEIKIDGRKVLQTVSAKSDGRKWVTTNLPTPFPKMISADARTEGTEAPFGLVIKPINHGNNIIVKVSANIQNERSDTFLALFRDSENSAIKVSSSNEMLVEIPAKNTDAKVFKVRFGAARGVTFLSDFEISAWEVEPILKGE